MSEQETQEDREAREERIRQANIDYANGGNPHRRKQKVHFSDDNTFEGIRCPVKSHPNTKPEDFQFTKIKSKCTCAGCLRSIKKDKKLIAEAAKHNPDEGRGHFHPSSDMAKLHIPHRPTCTAAQRVKDGDWSSVWSGIIRADVIMKTAHLRSEEGRLTKNRPRLWYLVSCNDYNCPGIKLVSSKVLQQVPGVGL